MLCDRIAEHGVDPLLYPPARMAPMLSRIKQAHKFVLSPEFALVADQLRTDLGQIVKALPLCRLPFHEVWIELAHNHRELAAAAPMNEWEHAIKRVGFLLTATNDKLTAFKGHMFWDMVGVPYPHAIQVGAWASDFDLEAEQPAQGVTIDPNERSAAEWLKASPEVRKRMLCVHHLSTAPDYGIPPIWYQLDAERLHEVMTVTAHDWAGEVQYILATLALLNTRNVAETALVDNARLNKARKRRGELPMFSFYTLKIRAKQLARVRAAAREQDQHTALRRHYVRGHWKVRKTGVYFWHPFLRGDASKGTVDKHYELT